MCSMYLTDTGMLYGLHNWGEAYLTPTWLVQEQRLAQVQINQCLSQSHLTFTYVLNPSICVSV